VGIIQCTYTSFIIIIHHKVLLSIKFGFFQPMVFPCYYVNFLYPKLEVHIILKVLTHKISITLNSSKKTHIIDLGLSNKTNYTNHEYAIDLYVCLYVIVHQ
jgi:hypothetical protein